MNKSSKNILIVSLLNLFFAFVEFIGGLFTNSISIMSDSIHDLGDSASLFIAYILEKKSNKEPDENYTFGYARYSLLGGMITSIILIIGSFYMIYNSILRIVNQEIVNYDGMLYLAIFGTVINYISFKLTHKSSKINEKAISLHLLEDLLGWIAVIVVSVVIKFTKLYILDSILSLCIALFIVYNVYKNIKEILNIIMEKKPENININDIKNTIKGIDENICDIHHVHAWSLDENNLFLSMHLVLNDEIKKESIKDIKCKIKHELNEKYNISHLVIETEFEKDKCDDINCKINCGECIHHHH